MVFSSNIFLFLFFPVVFIGYFIMPKFLKNFFLLIMSLFFYAWGEPRFVFVMIGSILVNYIFALLVEKTRGRGAWPKIFLAISVIINLGMLSVFKYLDFFITNLNALGTSLPLAHIALPIGISFFTFQAMSYVIDVYRGDVRANPRPQDIGLYISFFPQLIAGPIVRYQTIEKQISNRTTSLDDVGAGIRRFVLGLGKKVVLANNLSLIADNAFKQVEGLSVSFAWVGVLAYALQIYYDFSGYSDMAIGLGRIFGFHFLENFNYPYVSKTISEFWRRWHISLGQWFRDYVYFPLGGSRVAGRFRLVFNLFVVWFLTGLWHGASWNFILWGLIFFVVITFEKLTGFPTRTRLVPVRVLYQIFTLLVVLVGWVLFRSADIPAAASYLARMVGGGGAVLINDQTLLNLREYGVYLLASLVFATPVVPALRNFVAKKSPTLLHIGEIASPVAYFGLFIFAVSYLVMGAHNPFIYYNF